MVEMEGDWDGGSGAVGPPFPSSPEGGGWGLPGFGGKAALPEGAAGCCCLLQGARNCGVPRVKAGGPGVSLLHETVGDFFLRAPPGSGAAGSGSLRKKEPCFTMAQSSPGRAAPAEPPPALKNPKIGCLRCEGSAGPCAALPSPAARESLALPRHHRAQPGGATAPSPPWQP